MHRARGVGLRRYASSIVRHRSQLRRLEDALHGVVLRAGVGGAAMIAHINLQSILMHDLAIAAMQAVLVVCIIALTVGIVRRK